MATIAGTGYYVRRNDFKKEYEPMLYSVKRNVQPGEIVMGPSELGFALGFAPPLIDDCSLGFTSGIRPKIYVLYPACEIPGYSMDAWNWSHHETATHYHPVLRDDSFAPVREAVKSDPLRINKWQSVQPLEHPLMLTKDKGEQGQLNRMAFPLNDSETVLSYIRLLWREGHKPSARRAAK